MIWILRYMWIQCCLKLVKTYPFTEKEILKDRRITDSVQSPSNFYHSKLYCFLYCLFALFLFLNSVFTFISESIIHWTCYCIGSAELRHTKDGCMSCILTSIKISQKKPYGVRWISRVVMFNIFGCGQRNKAKFKTDNNNNNNTADSPKGRTS